MKKQNNYNHISKEELIKLVTVKDRFRFLVQNSEYENHSDFISDNILSKTSFYKIWNGAEVKDSTLEVFAAALDVNFDFLKYGGECIGEYVPRSIRDKERQLELLDRIIEEVDCERIGSRVDYEMAVDYILGKGEPCSNMFFYVIKILQRLDDMGKI